MAAGDSATADPIPFNPKGTTETDQLGMPGLLGKQA